jgi:hypothetical protein
MDYLTILLTLAMIWTAVDGAFRSGDDGPNWNLRWRSLDPAERARIAAGVRSHAEFSDPAEAELAEGFRRHDRRRHAYLELAATPVVVFLAALALAGVVPASDFNLAAAMALPFVTFVVPWLVKRKDRTPRAAFSPDAGR